MARLSIAVAPPPVAESGVHAGSCDMEARPYAVPTSVPATNMAATIRRGSCPRGPNHRRRQHRPSLVIEASDQRARAVLDGRRHPDGSLGRGLVARPSRSKTTPSVSVAIPFPRASPPTARPPRRQTSPSVWPHARLARSACTAPAHRAHADRHELGEFEFGDDGVGLGFVGAQGAQSPPTLSRTRLPGPHWLVSNVPTL